LLTLPAQAWSSRWSWRCSLATFVTVQARSAHPLLILASRNRGDAYMSIALAMFANYGAFLFLTYILQGTEHLSPLAAGLGFLPLTVINGLASTQVASRFMVRVPVRAIAVPGLAGRRPPVEQSGVGCGAVGRDVGTEHGGQRRRDRDHADRPVRPVLESALFVAGAAARPGSCGPRRGCGKSEHAPSGAGQVTVGVEQGDGFLRSEGGVVQAAEKAVISGLMRATASRSALTCAGLATTTGSRGLGHAKSISLNWPISLGYIRSPGGRATITCPSGTCPGCVEISG
jgi:hypothetical protein